MPLLRHVAGLKTHLDMERRIVGDALGQSECRTLVVGESGRVGMALRIADVPGDEEDSRFPVDVVDGRQFKERCLPRALFLVAVPRHRLIHGIDQMRCPAQHLVVDRVALTILDSPPVFAG